MGHEIAALVGLSVSSLFAAGKTYTEGTVWDLTIIRTATGRGDDYIKGLHETYKVLMDQAKKEGLILSYKILAGASANKDDWDMLLMVEYKNMAALDDVGDKFDALQLKLIGGEDKQHELMAKREHIRDIIGGKLMREVLFK